MTVFTDTCTSSLDLFCRIMRAAHQNRVKEAPPLSAEAGEIVRFAHNLDTELLQFIEERLIGYWADGRKQGHLVFQLCEELYQGIGSRISGPLVGCWDSVIYHKYACSGRSVSCTRDVRNGVFKMPLQALPPFLGEFHIILLHQLHRMPRWAARILMVMDHGLRREQDSIALFPNIHAQVRIFIVGGHITSIKSAQLLEDIVPNEQTGGGAKIDFPEI
jgi:hypothetical protein